MSATRLHILMSCVRPRNIPKISEYILECEPHPFEVRWHILQQGPDTDPKGILKANEALDWIKDGWVWFPSDDAQHKKEVFKRLSETIRDHQSCQAVVFSERRGFGDDTILHACPENMKPCYVDGSQPFYQREFIADARFEWDKYQEQCDGQFIQSLYQKNPTAFVFVDEVLMRFNSLEW